jgi:hypothetical protein
MRHKIAFVLAAVATSLMLSSCTPGDIGTVGLQREADGSLTALIRLCHGSADKIVLRAVNSFPHDPDSTPQSDHWESVPDVEQALEAPVHGYADVPVTIDEDSILDDVLYEVHTSSRDGWASSGFFGAAELAEVEPGRVLAPPWLDTDGVFEIRSRDDFESAAEDFC